jgi:putative transposase
MPVDLVNACRIVHCIVDNYATHRHPKVKEWLAARPRWHMHFTPTYSSWINQVERFFALITDKAIRRGSFTSVKQLVQKINHFGDSYNDKCQPFRSLRSSCKTSGQSDWRLR